VALSSVGNGAWWSGGGWSRGGLARGRRTDFPEASEARYARAMKSGGGGFWVRWTGGRGLRWGIAAGVIVVAVILWVPGVLPKVCEDQVAQTGEDGVVRVCRQLSISDPAVLGFLLLLLLAVWPDLSEVSVGIVKLTRKVDEQADRTERVSNEVRLLSLELRQTISQQVSQQVVQYIGTAATGEARDISTAAAPEVGVSLEEAFYLLRGQDAYQAAGIPDAWSLLERQAARPVRVAIVGTAIDPALQEVEAIGSHLEAPYQVTGAASQAVGETGTASVGHVLAIAPSAIIFPVSVFTSDGSVSTGALQEGVAAALGRGPDVLLIDLGGGSPIPEVEGMLAAKRANVLTTAPAGNGSRPASVWPGIIPGVVSIAALDQNGELASFSNYGQGVDLAAPGTQVISLLGLTDAGELKFGQVDGTSFSADIAAGVIALLLGTTELQPRDILGLLRQTATKSTKEVPVLDAGAATEFALSGKVLRELSEGGLSGGAQ
jgi:subtilisin family serine protease